jgi:hypothetical protein
VVRKDPVKVRVWVHKSSIAGLGLFAAQDVKQGTRILPYLGEKISKAERTHRIAQGNAYIFTFNDRYDIDGKILRNTARYINHSCDPNCDVTLTARAIWIVVLRDIIDGALNCSDFVVGRSWSHHRRVCLNATSLFSREWLAKGEAMCGSSASVDALQTAIN